MSEKIKIGDWVNSVNFGEAVCTGIEDEYIQLRYCATRLIDNKEIWVENSDTKDNVIFLKETDETAQYVLTLNGAYGEKNKIKM